VRKLFVYAALVTVGVVVLVVGSYANGSHDDRDDRGGRFSARLHGYQEVPANSTTGHGTFVARLDELNSMPVIEFRLTYAGLEGAGPLAAHIHLGQRTANGGVSAFLCGGGDKPACPPQPATVEGIIDAADVIGPTAQGIAAGEFAELVRAMRAGVTYANVHTTKHPGGEIRGQIELHDRGHDDHHGRDDH
jgi:CHRD domain-containing protein